MFINNDEILKVLNSFNPWWRTGNIETQTLKPMKRKAYFESKNSFMHKTLRRFVLLSGARRVGKTTILFQNIYDVLEKGINPKDILYISFDNPLLKFINIHQLIETYTNNIAISNEIYLFFDEIQYATDWDAWLKVLYDTMPEVRLMATGSASPLIVKGITESGTGRWTTINVPTLSFYEYCKLKNITVKELNKNIKIEDLKNLNPKELNDVINKLSHLQRDFNRYVLVGGFPELVLSDDDTYAQKILREDIVDKVLKRDIPELFNIRNVSILEKVFLYLCFNSSNVINYTTMSQVLENTSVQTIQDYMRYLKNANLIYINELLSIGGKSVLKSNPKIYIVDAAIRNAVLMNDNVLLNSEEMGYVVETSVYRHIATKYVINFQIGYCRDGKLNDNEREIDIVLKGLKNNKYIEVKYREDTKINKNNPIFKLPKKDDDVFVVTKKDTDYSITELESGAKMVKFPAFAFLYLIGREEFGEI